MSVNLSPAVNSDWTLATASLIASFCSVLWWFDAYFSAILFNKAASEAFCSKIVLSSDIGAASTTSDEVSDDSSAACLLNDSESDAIAGALTKADAVGASFSSSSAWPVCTSDVALRTAAATTIPFKNPRLVSPFSDTVSSCTSATIVSSTWPRITFRSPKFEVDARNQFLPDLINLNRVTRSVSRNSPFERLKNMLVSFFIVFAFIIHYYCKKARILIFNNRNTIKNIC